MRLSEIHAAIEAGLGPEFPQDQAFATLVAIEHLARIEGIPVSALDFAVPQFGAKYIYEFQDLCGSWGGRVQYIAWRSLILNAQMRFTPGDVDANPWASLRRAERLSTKREQSTIHDLCLNIPQGTHPREVTDALLETVHNAIPTEMLPRLRASLNGFRKLFCNELALRTGLLPDVCPNRLPPHIPGHRRFTSMSPEIEAWRSGLTNKDIMPALNYLNRLAIAGGRLNGKTDTLDDLRLALCDLPNPAELGVPSIDPKTMYNYVGRVRRALGGPDPRKSPSEQTWADLRKAARAAGCETSHLWAVSKPAAARGLVPQEITHTIALEIVASHHRFWRTLSRRGFEQLDALHGKVSSNLLPPVPLGIRPLPPREPKQVPQQNTVKTAWSDLCARLRARGWTQKQTGVLSYVRIRASSAGIAPGALSQDFINTLERDAVNPQDRIRLRAAVSCISTLSSDPEFAHLPDLKPSPDLRSTHGGAGPQARAEMEEVMEFMNASEPTRRKYRVSVGVLTDAMGRPDLPLIEILQTDISAYDLGTHGARRKHHTILLKSLRDFIELPWTPAWRELQTIVSKTGITLGNNPVPKVLSWNPSTDPSGLRLEWAQRLDLELRSTLKNPPHGRADLALTLARHLQAFDALHDIREIAASGLLPPPIGPIRKC